MSTQIRRLDDHHGRGHNASRLRAGRRQRSGGFSLTELLVLLAVVGVLATFATPYFLSYYRTAQVRGAASEIAAYLNQGRQLALQRNGNVCVHITASAMHYHLGGCGGAAWLGPGTDGAGNIPAPENITLSTTADPVFSYLGAATPAATYTVSRGAYSLTVTVSASGRVLIGP
jgi:prepilin-type N-terminal cleavage/methylation domain-containing protein